MSILYGKLLQLEWFIFHGFLIFRKTWNLKIMLCGVYKQNQSNTKFFLKFPKNWRTKWQTLTFWHFWDFKNAFHYLYSQGYYSYCCRGYLTIYILLYMFYRHGFRQVGHKYYLKTLFYKLYCVWLMRFQRRERLRVISVWKRTRRSINKDGIRTNHMKW